MGMQHCKTRAESDEFQGGGRGKGGRLALSQSPGGRCKQRKKRVLYNLHIEIIRLLMTPIGP